MKKNIKKFNNIKIFPIFLFFIFSNTASADMAGLLKNTAEDGAGFTTVVNEHATFIQVGEIISYILSFLGVIFVVLMIYAGFLWMTAAGESDKIQTAKNIAISAIIGLLIVLSANATTSYILSKI